ncbi:hypothetical protein N8I77_007010 [Diaporthe amygdali]|uniref:Uncharacterized protein n=1 Tax=Phomopsis amygdali TaxID=1214568 RepID=A0AAD9SAU5_PHOAM|nr:hypothetical protein N8I77_007010 [Diaporthe amygdali]
MTGTLTPVRPLGPLPLRLRVSTCIRESQETARRGIVWFVDGPSVHQPTVTCITDAIVQHANPSRFHEGVVLPLGTVEVVHLAAVKMSAQELGTFGPACSKPTGSVWGIFGSSKSRG